MKTKQVTVYVADDDTEFARRESAESHDRYLRLKEQKVKIGAYLSKVAGFPEVFLSTDVSDDWELEQDAINNFISNNGGDNLDLFGDCSTVDEMADIIIELATALDGKLLEVANYTRDLIKDLK